MTNWTVLVMEVVCVLLALVHLGVPEAIMCSRCSSKKDAKVGDCEKDPPDPTRCTAASDDQQYCIIAKEFHKNGSLKAFIRDCSTTSLGDECKVFPESANNGPQPHKICYKTCNTDGCNPAPPTAAPAALPALLAACLAGLALLRLRSHLWCS